ncbi:uncharacterized protein TRUGW13939_09564 [Talaromyces rugulosus]|uniref:Aminoglycoside phosphotransferase domain-containing protein n=1 Tax=Talaromyces rugulosus TaxID=121627 RepID=A0A7H8RAB4_TALRU|nr:uncharacterized protein TRUGW13939_09564 [Talaromyces rugulosus]QKX62405.1 hypothetical protein TRUGW13939_09564 [Talaromyces rugulosus]
MIPPEDHQRASVIASCTDPLPGNVVSQYGKRVIKISDHQVVKWGIEVTKEEAENQKRLYELVDRRIVRIPRVYDFFTDGHYGYIVMEFLQGKVIDPLEDDDAIQRVARVVNYLATFKHNAPGSLYGGACRGLLFPDTEDLAFDSLDEMEKWFNTRLFAHNPKLTLQGCELALCHLDIAPRNVLWQEDGTLCLLDWATAGYYPRLFEFSVQWILDGKDGNFNSLMLKYMNPLSEQEMAQKEAFMCAWRNIQKHPFRSKTSPPFRRPSARRYPVPAHPMPDYPPGWHEAAQLESPMPTEVSPGTPPTTALGPGEQNNIYSRITRYLRAIFLPRSKPSEAVC